MEIEYWFPLEVYQFLLHSERPKLYGVLAFLSVIGLIYLLMVVILIHSCSHMKAEMLIRIPFYYDKLINKTLVYIYLQKQSCRYKCIMMTVWR